jgi:hypothetical protein
MKSSDWLDMSTAPLNDYGKRYGPAILIWDKTTNTPVCAYFDPRASFEERGSGPGWIVNEGDRVIAHQDALAWMTVISPW